MPKTQKRLGRGLNSLISLTREVPLESTEEAPAGSAPTPMRSIEVASIRPNPFQPRRQTKPPELQALAESIKQAGLIQPIVVRRKDDGVYELITGERRWRACQMAGMTDIPAIIRDATDEQMLEMALVENIFREDLNAIDRARAYRRYCDEFNLTAEEVAARLGEDRSTVANYLRLLDLPSEVKQWVADGEIAMGHARCLLAVKSPSDLLQLARQAINAALSVRALEKRVREHLGGRHSATAATGKAPDAKRPQIRKLEELFIRELGTKVEISESRRKGSGKIVIHYYNLDDFDRVAGRLAIDCHH